MSFWQHVVSVFRRKNLSQQRRGLLTSIMEGIPATLINNLLGGPILTAYILYLGGASEEVGLVMAIPALANMFQLIVAYYMQRFNNRLLLLTIAGVTHRLVWVATGLIPFFVAEEYRVTVFIAMYLASFLFASTSGMLWTSIIADMVPAKVRGRFFGIRNTIHWAVASVALLIGGQILEHLNEATGFAVLYIIAAVCAVWNAIELRRYPNPPFEKSAEASSGRRFLKPLKDISYMKATLFIALFILMQNIAVPLFSFVMLDILTINYLWVTVITTVQMVVMMVSYYYWGTLNSRFASRTLLLWTLPIIAFSCLLWAGIELLPAILVLLLVHIALGFGLGGYNLLVFNFVIGDTPKADRPMYIAIFSALTGLTGFVGPMIGGWVYKEIDDSPYWLQSYGVAFLTGVVLLTLALTIGPLVLREQRHSK
ncbi:MFS transporter [Paenibacillus oenotherae]|uniref:MFS transporter n=1 Tax=Paenibacillus oenotherae TaxID=1435645 RepID=A0ABS7D9T6_9BACL|nr:MFS transporter [Paenibacillus oenotherae]MBW7476621.1 MFS transporter [Paenibacillus oenotherae]